MEDLPKLRNRVYPKKWYELPHQLPLGNQGWPFPLSAHECLFAKMQLGQRRRPGSHCRPPRRVGSSHNTTKMIITNMSLRRLLALSALVAMDAPSSASATLQSVQTAILKDLIERYTTHVPSTCNTQASVSTTCDIFDPCCFKIVCTTLCLTHSLSSLHMHHTYRSMQHPSPSTGPAPTPPPRGTLPSSPTKRDSTKPPCPTPTPSVPNHGRYASPRPVICTRTLHMICGERPSRLRSTRELRGSTRCSRRVS